MIVVCFSAKGFLLSLQPQENPTIEAGTGLGKAGTGRHGVERLRTRGILGSVSFQF